MKVMRFERSLRRGYRALEPVFAQRSTQYGDTLEECQWLTLRNIASLMGIKLTKRQARLLALAAHVDNKYWRQLGPFRRDTLLDLLAYNAALLGELESVNKSKS